MSHPADKREDSVPDHASTPVLPRSRRLGRWARGRRGPTAALAPSGAALLVTGIALLTAACSTASGAAPAATRAAAPTPASAPPPAVKPARGALAADGAPHGSYAALGDSYVAGLGIPGSAGAIAGCGQSGSSYPYLVARSLRLRVSDLSCSSATIGSLTAAQATGDGTNPAQLSALSSSTALVTLGIGGNDVGWGGVIARCTELDLIPALIPGGASSDRAPCRNHYTAGGTDALQRKIQAVAGPLAEALARVRRRAPHARVYVVGYPDLLPAAGAGCASALGLAEGDIAFLNTEEVRLNDLLRRVARAAGDGYIDTYTPSLGHSACAAPAARWIEPLIPDARAAPLHPNAIGEKGMANVIVAAVEA